MSLISTAGSKLSDFSERNMPNPYLFAILLSFIVYFAGILATDSGPLQMVVHWYDGFWKYLKFSMQMVMILVTGHALAIAPGVRTGIKRLAGTPNSCSQAILLTSYVSCMIHYVHWGLGLIVSAFFAREVAKEAHRRGVLIHYPLLVAAAFSGHMLWHVGPSTSAGLLSATKGHVFESIFGIVPMTDSVFSIYAIMIAIMLGGFVIPITMWRMTPKESGTYRGIDQYAPQFLKPEDDDAGPVERRGLADMLENSTLISYVIGLAGIVYVIYFYATKGFKLDLNLFNFIFLIAGIILHKTPIRYVRAINEATVGASGIILQFPFYAGIMGMMTYSGLASSVASGILNVATANTFPVICWLTGGLVNVFIPSGGGEWGVLGGIVGKISVELGVPIGKSIVAFGCGDMWTNMFQPFWAIALLGITGLRARDIMGYCMTLGLVGIPFFFIALYFFPY